VVAVRRLDHVGDLSLLHVSTALVTFSPKRNARSGQPAEVAAALLESLVLRRRLGDGREVGAALDLGQRGRGARLGVRAVGVSSFLKKTSRMRTSFSLPFHRSGVFSYSA